MAEPRSVTVGDRIAMWRGLRGWSQKQLADFSGLTVGFIGMLESGARQLNRRRDLTAIAEALQCTPEDLTGEPYGPADEADARAYAAIPDLRIALLDSSPEDPPDVQPRPLARLVEDLRRAQRAWHAGRYDVFGPLVPRLLEELYVLAADRDEPSARQALSVLVEASYLADVLAKGLGHPDLALLASDRARQAAAMSGDPALIGFADWVLIMTLERAGARRRAPKMAAAAVERMEPHGGDGPETGQVYGMLQLVSGLIAARFQNPDAAQGHLDEAAALADRLGQGNAYQLHFGPTNVDMWRVESAVELGEGPRAVELDRDLDPSVVHSPTREAAYWVVLGRGLAQRDDGGQDREAVTMFLRAERLNAQGVRRDPLVREIVAAMARRDRSGNVDLRSLARRLGQG